MKIFLGKPKLINDGVTLLDWITQEDKYIIYIKDQVIAEDTPCHYQLFDKKRLHQFVSQKALDELPHQAYNWQHATVLDENIRTQAHHFPKEARNNSKGVFNEG